MSRAPAPAPHDRLVAGKNGAGISHIPRVTSSSASSQPPSARNYPSHASQLANGCRALETHYRRLNKIAEGTYGVVYRGQALYGSREVVALKQLKCVKTRSQGFPLQALREISILSDLEHPNIVKVHEVVAVGPLPQQRGGDQAGAGGNRGSAAASSSSSAGNSLRASYCLVMEYLDHELHNLLKLHRFGYFEMKNLIEQLLLAVGYLHENFITHRDIKTSNLLYSNKNGVLKLCDFGLARRFGEPIFRNGEQEEGGDSDFEIDGDSFDPSSEDEVDEEDEVIARPRDEEAAASARKSDASDGPRPAPVDSIDARLAAIASAKSRLLSARQDAAGQNGVGTTSGHHDEITPRAQDDKPRRGPHFTSGGSSSSSAGDVDPARKQDDDHELKSVQKRADSRDRQQVHDAQHQQQEKRRRSSTAARGPQRQQRGAATAPLGGGGFPRPSVRYTTPVCTLWYRAPELLLGAKIYDPRAVDIWSVGCVAGEIIKRTPIFPAESESEQLRNVLRIAGKPDFVHDRFWRRFYHKRVAVEAFPGGGRDVVVLGGGVDDDDYRDADGRAVDDEDNRRASAGADGEDEGPRPRAPSPASSVDGDVREAEADERDGTRRTAKRRRIQDDRDARNDMASRSSKKRRRRSGPGADSRNSISFLYDWLPPAVLEPLPKVGWERFLFDPSPPARPQPPPASTTTAAAPAATTATAPVVRRSKRNRVAEKDKELWASLTTNKNAGAKSSSGSAAASAGASSTATNTVTVLVQQRATLDNFIPANDGQFEDNRRRLLAIFDRLCAINPDLRVTAEEALRHPFITEGRKVRNFFMPTFPETNCDVLSRDHLVQPGLHQAGPHQNQMRGGSAAFPIGATKAQARQIAAGFGIAQGFKNMTTNAANGSFIGPGAARKR